MYKSPKASLIEGGVAGTVELQTVSPLQSDKDHSFLVNARGMYNDRASEVYGADEYGHRLSMSYQGKFFDDTLGVALGYARLKQPSVATQFIGLAYNDSKEVDGLANDTNGPIDAPANEYISEGFELQHLGGVEIRNGYMGAIGGHLGIILSSRPMHFYRVSIANRLPEDSGLSLVAQALRLPILYSMAILLLAEPLIAPQRATPELRL